MTPPVFANSAWVSAPERLILRRGGRWKKRWMPVRYGLFVHPVAGPVLIDTGYTSHSTRAPGRSFWLRAYGWALDPPRLNEDAQPQPFLNRFGLGPQDITTVIVTHFHVDHVSGLAAFPPKARFIASGTAWASLQRSSTVHTTRHGGVFPELLPKDFAARLDPVEQHARRPVPHLPDGFDLFGDGSVLAIPLPGHAEGHLGVLFAQREVPLLYATDTQWLVDALPKSRRPPRLAPPRLISDDFAAMGGRSADQVAAFHSEGGGAVMLCHDDTPTPFDVEDGGDGS